MRKYYIISGILIVCLLLTWCTSEKRYNDCKETYMINNSETINMVYSYMLDTLRKYTKKWLSNKFFIEVMHPDPWYRKKTLTNKNIKYADPFDSDCNPINYWFINSIIPYLDMEQYEEEIKWELSFFWDRLCEYYIYKNCEKFNPDKN